MVSDRIEREIVIEAPVERVWAALLEPEFWLGEADPTGVEVREGGRLVSEHPDYGGSFPQLIEKIDPNRYLAYRWASGFPNAEPDSDNSTLVEFTLTEESGTTRLRVVESGFAGLVASEEQRRSSFEDNTGGWREVLDEFKQKVEKQQA
ncbi:SRPBCC domain-containing protein [Saccharopolyspora indica]|uniref:SRPBCC domain-containing protein n=1 Tax=Saccharopolyspora indica TaxID=1229659 RepID=UPI0022EAC477|nr:SRPBCC domain-containing protein [Saccharopolyspora indica]MDA3643406.1 SRPBCC domain-containing protein [Saccharopolyspora indica]